MATMMVKKTVKDDSKGDDSKRCLKDIRNFGIFKLSLKLV